MSSLLPLYIVNEYPKAGGSWVGEMLADSLQLPFPRNRFPVLKSSIMHGHYLKPAGMRNVLLVWRDGRDVMVSYYYHCFLLYEMGNQHFVQRMKRFYQFDDYANITSNLPAFIKSMFDAPPSPHFSWADFVRVWADRKDMVHVKYEQIRLNPEQELARVVYELSGKQLSDKLIQRIVKKHAMPAKSKQDEKASETKFIRKGYTGEWKEHFNLETKQLFEYYAGESLIKLGYEQDAAWVNH